MNRPDPTFDLIAVQRLNGAYLDTLATDIPGSGALARLRHMEAEHDFGAGTTLMLVPTADPLHQVRAELHRAQTLFAPLNSAHEAYAVILEELDEFKAEVWKKPRVRDLAQMRVELIQVAAMAIRAIEDLSL